MKFLAVDVTIFKPEMWIVLEKVLLYLHKGHSCIKTISKLGVRKTV